MHGQLKTKTREILSVGWYSLLHSKRFFLTGHKSSRARNHQTAVSENLLENVDNTIDLMKFLSSH